MLNKFHAVDTHPFTLTVDGQLIDYYPTSLEAALRARVLLNAGAKHATIHDEVNLTQQEIHNG